MNSAIQNSSRTRPTVASEQPVASMLTAHQRQALLWALGGYLEPQDAQAALLLWQPGVGGAAQGSSALAGLSRYCRAVAIRFGLQGREAELHLRIIRGLQARPADLVTQQAKAADVRQEPALSGPSQTASHSANDSVPPADGTAVCVQCFLEAVEAMVSRECPERYSPRAWRQSLLVHTSRLHKSQVEQLAAWLWGHSEGLFGEWPARGSGTRVINASYVALAQWLGPVRADACFTQVVREFENSQDPVLMSVRRYL
jgi:hypothetical protein